MEQILKSLNTKFSSKNMQHEIKHNFSNLRTDQQRVMFTLDIMRRYDIVPNATRPLKNTNESNKLRKEGNVVFIESASSNISLIKAHKLYTQAIAVAAVASEELALAYANRSAVLFRLDLHTECIQDIDRALALKYPDDLKAKLYMRKTESLIILGNSKEEDSKEKDDKKKNGIEKDGKEKDIKEEHSKEEHSKKEGSTEEDSKEEHSKKEDSKEEDSTEKNSKEEGSKEKGSTEEDSKEEGSTEEDSKEEHSKKEDSKEEDSKEEGSTEKDSKEEGSTEKDSKEEGSTEEHSKKEDSTEEDSKEEHSKKEDSKEEVSKEEHSKKEDSKEEVSTEKDSKEEDSTEEGNTEEGNTEEDSKNKDSKDDRKSVEEMLEETQRWIDKMPQSNPARETLKIKIQDLQHQAESPTKYTCSEKSQKAGKERRGKTATRLPTVVSHNDEVPCASSAVAIAYNAQYGKHVVATRHINPGEVIAVEKPYSLMLRDYNLQTHCSNCLRVSWATIPCYYCSYTMYCSKKCRRTEWQKYHYIECDVFPHLIKYDFSSIDFFSARLALLAVKEAGGIRELKTMLKEIDQRDDPRTKGFSPDGKLHSDRYNGIYSLVTNTEKRPMSDLFRKSMDSCFMLYFLATHSELFGAKVPGDLDALVDNDDITYVGSLILRHQQIIPCNIHTLGEEQGLQHVGRGIVALPFHSCMNHSCNPNVLLHSRPNHMVAYAMYPIEKGEQVFDNYGQHYAVLTRVDRQQSLLKQFYFHCNCIPCQQNWPLYDKLESFKILVQETEIKDKIRNALRKFDQYFEMAGSYDIPNKMKIKMIKDLLKMVLILHTYVPKPCHEIGDVVETLKRIYDLSGNRFMLPEARFCK